MRKPTGEKERASSINDPSVRPFGYTIALMPVRYRLVVSELQRPSGFHQLRSVVRIEVNFARIERRAKKVFEAFDTRFGLPIGLRINPGQTGAHVRQGQDDRISGIRMFR